MVLNKICVCLKNIFHELQKCLLVKINLKKEFSIKLTNHGLGLRLIHRVCWNFDLVRFLFQLGFTRDGLPRDDTDDVCIFETISFDSFGDEFGGTLIDGAGQKP